MNRRTIITLSGCVLLSCFIARFADAAGGSHEKLMREYREREAKAAAAKKTDSQSIWEDESEANPYFRKQKSGKTKKTATKKEKNVNEPKRSSFKRRVYTGPSKNEIAVATEKKAVANFRSFLASGDYDVQYDKIAYDQSSDTLSVSKIVFLPVVKNGEKPLIPYLMKADELALRNVNIGEKEGTPLSDDGELVIGKLEIPVWNDKGVKKGKVDVDSLKMTGDLVPYLKAKGNGTLNFIEIKNLRSETIINETVLNNIVRSKVFSASSAAFQDVKLQSGIVDALKRQDVDGLEFSSVQINGQSVPSVEGIKAAMTSYSARVLNTDLVLGARLEAQKEKPNPDPDLELLKKNVEENKEAILNAIAETLK